MAMFDLKDSEDIKLTECHTDSSQLVRGDGLKRLEVADSTALAKRTGPPLPPERKILRFIAKNVFASLVSLAVALIAGYLLWRLGWSG